MARPGGPPPIPKNLHLLKNPNQRAKKKARTKYPEPKSAIPVDPPDWLCRYGKQEWRRVVKGMQECEVYVSVDRAALEMACHWYGTFREAVAEVRREGPYITWGARLIESPAAKAARDASKKYLDYALHLGLTPTARMKLGKEPEGPERDELSKHDRGAPKSA